MSRLSSLSLVIPAHNEAGNMARVITNSRTVLQDLADTWEIVLVDDGSTDDTIAIATRALGADAGKLKVIRHPHKSGYAATVCDGLHAGSKDFLAFMDGDGQFDPADLQKLAPYLQDAGLVTGERAHRADPLHRSIVSGIFNILVRVLYGVRIRDVDCGLKIMDRQVFACCQPILARSAVFNTEMYYKARQAGFRVVQVPVPHYPRLAGVRSGGRLKPILRAIRDVLRLRWQLRGWSPSAQSQRAG